MAITTGIGGAIRHVRQKKDVSLNRLASETDIDPGNLSRFERGKEGMSEANIKRMADYLGIRMWQLYLLAEEEHAEQKQRWLEVGEGLTPDERATAIRLFSRSVAKQASEE